ncbi:MAG TPA: divalent metal cation transporter [Bacteroidetes bacterium]|nr:divalent metal cation transporter [Bacteroidota bacterium]
MKKLLSVLFWSVISAAFIGPGTVTTAASSGAHFGFTLLWALLFSTIACLVLQEASARLTVVSGKNLGQTILWRFPSGFARLASAGLVLGAIWLGCAAYEAGNILGGVAGAQLGTGIPTPWLTLLIALIAGLLLFFGSTRTVASLLGTVVAMMGVAFLVTAVLLRPPVGRLISGLLIPRIPAGSALLVIGLIGTTVVPYNLFLGSGIARGQELKELRFGLTVAILLGGIISMGVLVVGTALTDTFSFSALADALAARLGAWARPFFAFGLFAAGFSSAITAPLAAAITFRSVLGESDGGAWSETGWRYRTVWMSVLGVGLFFGLSGVKPIPAIILAQALNGVLLPFVAFFLLIVTNSRELLGPKKNPALLNVLMALIVLVVAFLGMTNLIRAGYRLAGTAAAQESVLLMAAILTLLLAAGLAAAKLVRRRAKDSKA